MPLLNFVSANELGIQDLAPSVANVNANFDLFYNFAEILNAKIVSFFFHLYNAVEILILFLIGGGGDARNENENENESYALSFFEETVSEKTWDLKKLSQLLFNFRPCSLYKQRQK